MSDMTDVFGRPRSFKMTAEEYQKLQEFMPPISPAPIVDSSGRPVLDASGKPMMTPPDQIVLSPEDQAHRIEIAMQRKENRERYEEQKKRDAETAQLMEKHHKEQKERKERQAQIWSRVTMLVCNKPTCPMTELGKDLKPLLNHLRDIIKSSIQVDKATMARLASFFNEDEEKKSNYHAVINRLMDMAEAKK